MKFTMTKIAAAMALTMAASGAHALQVVSMTLDDTINAATNTLGTDGKEGAFRFNVINPVTYSGSSLFYGDIGTGSINLAGPAAPGSFSTGFLFTGAPFIPDTVSASDLDITGGVLSVNTFDFGGFFAGAVQFTLPPDAGTLVVNNLIQTGANTYAYRMQWSHDITDTDDPSGSYVGFNARWMLEGTMTTVPEPETYGMLAAGLGLVGAAVRRRRRSV